MGCLMSKVLVGDMRGQNPSRTGLAQGLDLCLKYGPRELRSECYTSLGSLYVPREVDLADRLGSLRSPRLVRQVNLPRDV